MHIAIAGNIGSGKTTLTRMLAAHYGWEAHFEAVDHNPYLEDYYKDIPRWAFPLEVYFLKERFKDVLNISRSVHSIIQDRSIYEGVYVFAQGNRDMGHLSERDFDTYLRLFEQMVGQVRYPDLMIYLRCSVPHLVDNIQKRNRNYEQSISLDYLESINRRYEDFIFHHYPGQVLVVEADTLDFEHREEDFGSILQRIDKRLYNLFDN